MNPTATILLAEDNADDVVLMQLAFKKAGLTNPIHVVSNGNEALEYLKGAIEARSAGSDVPLLISLDLNLPLCDGFQILSWIKKQPIIEDVPVFILSESDHPRDIHRASNLGANAYLIKPATFDALVGIVEIFKKTLNQPFPPNSGATCPKRSRKHTPPV